jgi:DNA-binding response OmpR family regulator
MEGGSGGRLLVVTDNEWRRVRLRRILEQAGYHVILVGSTREALQLLAAWSRRGHAVPAAALVDQHSLGRSASLVIRAVRNAKLGIPIVVLSARADADQAIMCLREGASDYVCLPAESHRIVEVVGRAIAGPMVS